MVPSQVYHLSRIKRQTTLPWRSHPATIGHMRQVGLASEVTKTNFHHSGVVFVAASFLSRQTFGQEFLAA